MKAIYYIVNVYDVCECCGNETTYGNSDFKSFSEARDLMLEAENASLTTNDPIAKYYLDDDRIIYREE